MLLGIRGKIRMFFKDICLQLVKKLEIRLVLPVDHIQEWFLKVRALDLLRDNEILIQRYVPLRLFRVSAQPELLKFFHDETRDPDHIEVEYRVFGHRMVTHLEYNGGVGPSGLFNFLSCVFSYLVDRPGVTAYTSVRRRKHLRRKVLAFTGLFFKFAQNASIDIISC